MSIFKRFGNKSDVKAVASPSRSPFHRNNVASASGSGHCGSSLGDMGAPRPRSGTDPQTCLEVYKSHWSQALAIINRNNGGGGTNLSPLKRSLQEEVEAVTRYVDQMVLLAVEEESQDGGHGPILEYTLMEDILEKLLVWSSQKGEHTDRLRLHQLKMYELLICQARQSFVIHKPIIRPLLRLLSVCKEHPNKEIEALVILILHQICVCIMKQNQLLELLFNSASEQGPAKFLMFSLLIPYVHREGTIGQQARDALLLIMALSSRNNNIGRYVAENSDFCPVLATGLSGLYSSLPQKLDYPSDDWSQITEEDISHLPDLVMFLNSLEFCNAVVQVAHPLVRDQLLNFIYNGFLVPVLGPALHQNDVVINDSTEDDVDAFFDFDDDLSSMEEVITATAYLDLFIRKVTEAELMRTFLQFLLTEKYDDVYILDSLVQRINSNSRLCMVTLSLFSTLVNLNCEDFMFQLVFKYLIPCTHVMVSQRRSVKDVDLYSKTAEKLLSLTPSCCSAEFSESPSDGTKTPDSPSSISTKPTDSSNIANSPASPSETRSQKAKRFLFGNRLKAKEVPTTECVQGSESARSSSPDVGRFSPMLSPKGLKSSCTYETHYMEYLSAARVKIHECTKACECWAVSYDGENPSPDCDLTGIKLLGNQADLERDHHMPDVSRTDESGSVVQETSNSEDISHRREPVLSGCQPVAQAVDGSSSSQPVSDGGALPTDDKTPVTTSDQSQGTYAESVTSEADSGLSASSAQLSTNENPASRSDSPLNDNFDDSDFNAFLLSLKRVQTPVEFCDNIEDSFNEIDSVISELKQLDIKLVSRKSSVSKPTTPKSESLPAFESTPAGSEKVLKPQASTSKRNTTDTESSNSESISVQDKDSTSTQISPPSLQSSDSTAPTSLPSKDNLTSGVVVSAFSQVKPGLKSSGVSPVFTPTKYNLGTPNIGPFLSTILNKLECMMQNSLYVNLLLTGLVTRLACYPQPLVRSFLLNHTLVFQPTVKSLVQVLSSVKHKVDCYSYTVKEFDSMMTHARRFLAWRDEMYRTGGLNSRRDSTSSLPASGTSRNKQEKEKRRGSTLSDLLFRRKTPEKKSIKEARLQLLGDNKGFRYINRSNSPQEGTTESLESLKTKNTVYCALVLEEFIKELSAVSQEHAVLCAES